MKGLSTTLIIVISAVVILVAALVVLTIFGQGVSQVATLAQAKSTCEAAGKASCSTTGALPPTWKAPTNNIQDQGMQSCMTVIGKTCTNDVCKCDIYGW